MGEGFVGGARGRIGIVVVAGLLVAGLVGGLLLLPRGGEVAAQAPAQTKPGAGQGASVPVQVTAVQSGAVQQKTTLTGDLQPRDKVQIVSKVSARITKLSGEVGQVVKPGDALVELDRTQLEAALGQAQAQLASAKANRKKIEDGARPEDVAAAQAAAKQAAEQLANARATAGAVRNQDIATAQAAVAAAEARLRQVTQGPTEADIAAAQAALAGAQARYQAVLNGPRSQDIDIAVQALNTAKDSRSKLESQLANAKEQARIAVDLATSALSGAQSNYGAAKLVYDEAVRTEKDPNIPACKAPQPKNCRDLTDTKLRQYKATFESAEQALRQAEQQIEARQLAYEDAKKQEISSLQQADAQIQSAQATLDKLKAGNTTEDITSSKSAVDQAQAAIDKLNQPARQADIDAAKATLDQAKASLAKLQASPTTVGQAQATLEQQQALAKKAANPYLPSDLESAEAQVMIAEAGIKTAEANLKDATLVAPFAGLISAKNVSEGALAAPGAVLLEVVSNDVRGVFTIEETQVGQIKLGQAATLTTTAYPGEQFQGVVSTISPTANASTRSFGIKITPADPQGRLKSGMFAQAEIVTAEKQNALVVPEAAVLTRDGKTVVFVVADGKAQRREVATGLRADGKIELTQGVQAGDQVVTTGQNLLNDGDSVTVR